MILIFAALSHQKNTIYGGRQRLKLASNPLIYVQKQALCCRIMYTGFRETAYATR